MKDQRRTITLANATWRTSSYSGGNNECVAVATTPMAVPVRDSKRPAGPILAFGRAAWAAFLDGLR